MSVSRARSTRVVSAQITSFQSRTFTSSSVTMIVLRVHELAQEAPHAEHHALGVPRVLLLQRDDGEAIRAALRRQVEVRDLRETASAEAARTLR
jgi:hypothetical protein